jgi:hypothetical protein
MMVRRAFQAGWSGGGGAGALSMVGASGVVRGRTGGRGSRARPGLSSGSGASGGALAGAGSKAGASGTAPGAGARLRQRPATQSWPGSQSMWATHVPSRGRRRWQPDDPPAAIAAASSKMIVGRSTFSLQHDSRPPIH